MESVVEPADAKPEVIGPHCRDFLPAREAAMRELDKKVRRLTAACNDLGQYKLLSREIEIFIAAKGNLLPKQYVWEVSYRRSEHVRYSVDFFRLYERLLGTSRENAASLRTRSDRLEKYIQANKAYLPPELLEKYRALEKIADIRKVLPKAEPPKKRVSAGFVRRRPKN